MHQFEISGIAASCRSPAFAPAGRGISRVKALVSGDPSLRLEYGCARCITTLDDAHARAMRLSCRILPISAAMSPVTTAKPRLAYIDWMRGLACVLMFQTHCYDSWLSGQARQSRFFMYSQLGGTFPAPLFLFLAGISFALVTEKLRLKNVSPTHIARATIRRGAEIFAFGLLFRLQEYVVAWGWAPKTDLLRVDVLNTIGDSMMLMGVLCWIVLSFPTQGSPGGPSLPRQGGPSLPRFLRQGWETPQRWETMKLVLASSAN